MADEERLRLPAVWVIVVVMTANALLEGWATYMEMQEMEQKAATACQPLGRSH